jgi:hypothetical protein
MRHPTFIEGYIIGDLHEEDLNNWVDNWHNRFEQSDVTLYEYLGMTPVEYDDWVSKCRTLQQIVQDRDVKKPNILIRAFDSVFWWVMHKIWK